MANTRSSTKAAAAAAATWHHSPTSLTLLWMAISLPLVTWDTIYCLGRPHTMEGGFLHWPLYVPYKLYGEVDHVYGWKSFDAKNGFTSAQGLLNAVETAMYLYYLWVVYSKGVAVAAADGQKQQSRRAVQGRDGAFAVLVGFSAAVMTLSKTVLYWANEYYSDFSSIGHNNATDLIFLWIIPNGAWLIGSAYMICSIGSDIVDGLTTSTRAKDE